MDSLQDDSDQSGVKTEPAISAENFGVMETSSYSEEEPSEMKDIETPQESDSSPTGDTLNSPEEIHNPETPDDSNPELNIDEKIQIANFCRDNPAIPGILVCENFSTKFKKCISAPTLHQIISTGVEQLEKEKDHINTVSSMKRKNKVSARIPQIEEYVLKLFEEADLGKPGLTGPFVRTKALQYAKLHGHDSFNASKGWLLRFLSRHKKVVSIPNADKDRSDQHEVRTRNQFSLCEKHEVAKYLVENPNMLAKDIALYFSEKFSKPLTADTVRRIKSEGDKLLDESLANDNRYKNKSKSSNFPEIEQVMLAVMEEAEKQKMTLTSGYIRNMALELAKQLGIENFNASQGWLQRFQMRHGKKLDDGRKLRQNRPKPSPFVRLTFGEKHEIASFMQANPGMQLKQYAEIFTKKWSRNVTERQIMGTKENLTKWADEQYKGSNQSYEKITRKPRTCLSKSEREDIAAFISQNSGMTLEETARIFSEKWNKDINRTHIASAKRMVQNIQNMITADIQSVLDSSNEVSPIDSSNSQPSPKIEHNPLGLLNMTRNSDARNELKHQQQHQEETIDNKIENIVNNPPNSYSGLDLYSHFIGNAQKQEQQQPVRDDNLSSNSIFSKGFPNLAGSDVTSHLSAYSSLSQNLSQKLQTPHPTSDNSINPPNNSENNKSLSDHFLLHSQGQSLDTHNNQPQNMFTPQPLTITCPQCYRQFDSGPFFWYHFSVEHSNLFSSNPLNSLGNINPLNSPQLPSQPISTPLNSNPLNSLIQHNDQQVGQNESQQNYINSSLGGFGLSHHINPAI